MKTIVAASVALAVVALAGSAASAKTVVVKGHHHVAVVRHHHDAVVRHHHVAVVRHHHFAKKKVVLIKK